MKPQAQIQADERIDVHTNTDQFQNRLHSQRYQRVLDTVHSASNVLEVGTGLGVFSAMLAPVVNQYRGIEYDVEACTHAQKRLGSETLITRGDAQQLDFNENYFDEVVCLEVLEHLPDYRRALDEVVRVLKVGGRFHVSIPYRREGGASKVNPHHLYEPGEKEFLTQLKSRFRDVNVLYQIYTETSWMTIARCLHIRQLVGLVKPYRQLTQGQPDELDKIVLDENRGGLLLHLYCECTL